MSDTLKSKDIDMIDTWLSLNLQNKDSLPMCNMTAILLCKELEHSTSITNEIYLITTLDSTKFFAKAQL